MSSPQIKQRLESMLTYLQPYWELFNCHMVNYLSDALWLRLVPDALRAEVADVTRVQQCIEQVFWRAEDKSKLNGDFVAFRRFIADSEAQRLCNFKEILCSLADVRATLGMPAECDRIAFKEFMSEKKRHEVEVTSALVHDLIAQQQAKGKYNPSQFCIIDAGDGKGYLSTQLALQYQHCVLGIDADATNTTNAQKRGRKLQRAWKNLQKHNANQNDTQVTLDNYKTTATFITTDLNCAQLLQEYFPQLQPAQLCLTGLHTCGNLAPTCLKLFHAQNSIKLLCNVGCCYHLLREQFAPAHVFDHESVLQQAYGFPMSQFLRDKEVCLGRNARMLASQSVERTMAARELPNTSLYYRALLELIVCAKANSGTSAESLQVGKVHAPDFETYLRTCSGKTGLELELDERWTNWLQLAEQHVTDQLYMQLFYLLRMSFAPVLESLILLDRLLYLQELGYERSYLVALFDAVKSPRRYGIIAVK